jgi:hypothetical protein
MLLLEPGYKAGICIGMVGRLDNEGYKCSGILLDSAKTDRIINRYNCTYSLCYFYSTLFATIDAFDQIVDYGLNNYVKQYSDLKSFSRWIDRAKKHSYMGIDIFSLDYKEKADVAFVNLVEKIDGFCKLHMDILIVNFEYNNNQRILVTNIHPEAKTPTHLAAIINNDCSRLVKEGYRTLPFPFEELPSPKFSMETVWTLADVLGFVYSWSGTANYEKREGRSLMDLVTPELTQAWAGREKRLLTWRIFLRAGMIKR